MYNSPYKTHTQSLLVWVFKPEVVLQPLNDFFSMPYRCPGECGGVEKWYSLKKTHKHKTFNQAACVCQHTHWLSSVLTSFIYLFFLAVKSGKSQATCRAWGILTVMEKLKPNGSSLVLLEITWVQRELGEKETSKQCRHSGNYHF